MHCIYFGKALKVWELFFPHKIGLRFNRDIIWKHLRVCDALFKGPMLLLLFPEIPCFSTLSVCHLLIYILHNTISGQFLPKKCLHLSKLEKYCILYSVWRFSYTLMYWKLFPLNIDLIKWVKYPRVHKIHFCFKNWKIHRCVNT